MKSHLHHLLAVAGAPKLSIYMPAHRAGKAIEQDPIRLKNLLRQARRELENAGLRGPRAREFLKPLSDLVGQSEFWRHQSDGLALFRSPEWFSCYRMPLAFPELAVVAQRFHVKPLMPLLVADGRFFILALSQNRVRVLEATRFHAAEVVIKGLPESLREVSSARRAERKLQFHTAAAATIYHGHGGAADSSEADLMRFFRRVNQDLTEFLNGEQAPLVAACVDHLFALYRKANTNPLLLEEFVRGSPENLKPEELHGQAWPIAESYFVRSLLAAVEQYRKLAGTDRVSDKLETVLPAAFAGRVASLLVPAGVQRWGTFSAEREELAEHEKPQPGDEDLLNLAAVQTYLTGGAVFVVAPEEMPSRVPTAAVLRY